MVFITFELSKTFLFESSLKNDEILLQNFQTVLTLTLKMTTAEVVETSVTVNNNSPIQDYVHPDDQTQPTFEVFIILEFSDSRFCGLTN